LVLQFKGKGMMKTFPCIGEGGEVKGKFREKEGAAEERGYVFQVSLRSKNPWDASAFVNSRPETQKPQD